MVIAFGKGGQIAEEDVMGRSGGPSVGIDLTRRDLQGRGKKAGRPWVGAAFGHFAPIARLNHRECPSIEQGDALAGL